MGLRDATNRRWGEIINKALGGVESTLAGIWEKNLHKTWSTCRHGRTAGERFGDWRGSPGGNKRHTRTQQSIIWWMVFSNRQGKKQHLFFLTLHDNINDMKLFLTLCITPQPCHSHCCCWWLPIWPKLDVWAENWAYGLCRLGWRYNWAKLSFSWSYLIVSIIWNTSEMSALHLSRATDIFVVDCCQFGPSLMFGLKMELMACAGLVGGTTEQSYFFPDLIW